MNKLRSCSIAIMAPAVLACLFALLNPNTSHTDSTKGVIVANTANQPIPAVVQGNAGIAGAIQAQQSGPECRYHRNAYRQD
jgi:hypothetical protein